MYAYGMIQDFTIGTGHTFHAFALLVNWHCHHNSHLFVQLLLHGNQLKSPHQPVDDNTSQFPHVISDIEENMTMSAVMTL
jgi:hypothetical protein